MASFRAGRGHTIGIFGSCVTENASKLSLPDAGFGAIRFHRLCRHIFPPRRPFSASGRSVLMTNAGVFELLERELGTMMSSDFKLRSQQPFLTHRFSAVYAFGC
jgi:hypothetical protein